MGAEQSKPAGPELTQGIPVENLPDGHMLTGHVGDDAVLLARRGNESFAGRSVPITEDRLPKGSWSTTPCDVLGTMTASACARGRLCTPRP
jgi:hypothetical protein